MKNVKKIIAVLLLCSCRLAAEAPRHMYAAVFRGEGAQDAIAVFDWKTADLLTKIPVEAPVALAANPNGRSVYALTLGASFDNPTLSVISGATNKIRATIPIRHSQLSSSRYSVTVSPDGKTVWVLLSDSSLTVVCAVTNVVLAHFQIDPALHILFGPVFSRNGKFAYVVGQFPQTMSDTAELEVISTDTRKVVARTEIGPFEYPQSLAISRDGKKLYVSSENAAAGPNNLVGEVSTFSARTGKLLTALQIPTGTVQSLTVAPDGREVYGILEPFSSPFCSTIMIIDEATDNLIDRVPLGEIAYNLQFTPNGRAYWLNGVTLSNQESFLEARSRERNRIIHKIESLPGATNPGFDVFVIEPMARDHQPSRPRGATELAPSD